MEAAEKERVNHVGETAANIKVKLGVRRSVNASRFWQQGVVHVIEEQRQVSGSGAASLSGVKRKEAASVVRVMVRAEGNKDLHV